jgi:DNA-binding NarL/FixJ family response regulator
VKARVLLADDHAIVRSGLRLLLERESDLAVAGEASDGREAVDWLARERADVVVMDLGMPGLNGIEATGQIVRRHAGVRVVVLSMHRDEAYVLRALRAGARGYVLKESAEGELIAAVRAVLAGRSYFSPRIGRMLQAEHIERARSKSLDDPYDLLTGREREVFQRIAEGNSNKEIAARLCLSVLTVETHRKRILEKLSLHGTAELMLYAARRGIIP